MPNLHPAAPVLCPGIQRHIGPAVQVHEGEYLRPAPRRRQNYHPIVAVSGPELPPVRRPIEPVGPAVSGDVSGQALDDGRRQCDYAQQTLLVQAVDMLSLIHI